MEYGNCVSSFWSISLLHLVTHALDGFYQYCSNYHDFLVEVLYNFNAVLHIFEWSDTIR